MRLFEGVKIWYWMGGRVKIRFFFIPIRFCSGAWCQRLCGLAGLRPVTLQKFHGVNLKNQSDCIYILIAFTERGDNIRIISLRKATSREARNYVESQA